MKQLPIVKNVCTKLSLIGGRTKLKIQKNSPEILLGIGIVSFVGTVVAASKATLKAEDILNKHTADLKMIKDAKKIAEEQPNDYEYDEKLAVVDTMGVYGRTVVDFAKLYAPAIGLAALSLTCILSSRNIMKRRYLGAVAAFNTVSEVLEKYRKRVRDEQGEIMDRHFMYGTELDKIEVTTVDENGKKKKETMLVEKDVQGDDLSLPSENSVWFDESNRNWDPNPNFNMMFLRGQQDYWTDVLRTRGHVFLNEVLDSLGFEHTPAGALIGWIKGLGDNCVDFGLYNINRKSTRDFTNGLTNVVLLEFNHDGVIWDKLDNA